MSIKIKKTTGEIFDLPPDYVIESEKTNPLFTTKGSQSISIAFQNTANNRRLLDFADRIDKQQKSTGTTNVVVESGPVQQSGVMVINSASDKTITANIGWDESEMYVKMGTTLLRDLNNLPVLNLGGATVNDRVDSMLKHLTAVMKEKIDADYYVFPVVLKEDEVEDDMQTCFEMLNEYESYRLNSNGFVQSHGEMGELLALKDRIIPRYVDSEVILFDVPKGYGVSPFLKVWRLLELIIEHYGFSLANNPFREHRQLRKLVVLNNTMDAILTGKLYYRDMMPDITVKDFFDALYNKFGLQYFVDSNTRSITLKFWKDVLASPQLPVDITKYKTAPVSINYSQNKQLKLVANREIEGTEVQYNTFEEFLKAYQYQFFDAYFDVDFTDIYTYSSVFLAYLRCYTINDYYRGTQYISYDFFDWDKKADLPYEEIKMTDLCLPVRRFKNLELLYPVGYKHAYSDISISGEAIESEQKKAKLAFVFGWGKTSLHTNMTDSGKQYRFNYFFASQDNRNMYGRFMDDPLGVRYDLSLTIHREDGLFNRFWKEYDAFLRHSSYAVEAKLKLPEPEILQMKMFQVLFIDYQPLLPEQIRYKQNKVDAISDCKFKTIRLYEPNNLALEQKIETYYPQPYYWRYESVKSSDIEQWLIDQNIYYEIDGHPADENENRKSLLLLPPTEEEYLNQLTRIFEYNYVVECYLLREDIHHVITLYPTRIPS